MERSIPTGMKTMTHFRLLAPGAPGPVGGPASGGNREPMNMAERREVDPATRRQQLAARLAAMRAEYSAAATAGRAGRIVQAKYAGEMDGLIRGVADQAGPTGAPVVVCAIGGYGRRPLCLHSDIDLLIVFQRNLEAREEQFVKGLLQPLWDLGLTVGHHIREIGEFDAVDESNPELLLSLYDLRLLVGDVKLFDDLLERIHRGESSRGPRLVSALLALVEERYREFNDTLYQLEPDIKKAPRGLRDIGAIRLLRTIAREAFAGRGRPDGERLDEAEEFLLRIRSMLHVRNGRDSNVLTHDLQERVAVPLRFAGEDPRQRVEAL